MEIRGIHQLTAKSRVSFPTESRGSGAIAGDAQRNVDFYAGILGRRLVKLTVNHDHPSVYHIYYGDAAGRRERLQGRLPPLRLPRAA